MKYLLTLLLSVILIRPCNAQNVSQIVNEKTENISFTPPPITGLWVIEKVLVYDKNLSPTAKGMFTYLRFL
ncbi:hypothetical protein [Roseivirga ehrenbergii]|uniref:hypothetical protein n=1 Tax=Roseivirga ehrenbergii (strain DSM 102268 / JCM 13514 / KCTC 12282 / NCIMB 14502 / KMM 6017) TaxID=279360 RepID=UPI000AE56D05|nr:hypothetical protein [Roseivirga ehrenbergii]